MNIPFETNDKINYLYSEAALAVRSQDWERFGVIAGYDADTGAYLIKLFEERIPLDIKCRIALEHYSSHGDFYPILRKYVRKAGIIRPENWREDLPVSVRELDEFVIYRGGGEDIRKAACALSWTLSRETAEWFMRRHALTHPGEQHLYRGVISADKVIAYIKDRDESEIVQYRGVKEIEEIVPYGISI